MPDLGTSPLARCPELLLSPLDTDRQYVVKDRASGAYYTLGPEEAFLLERFDGSHTAEPSVRPSSSALASPFPVTRGESPTEPDRPSVTRRLDTPSTVTVCCRVEDPQQELRPGMTGYARIYRGQRQISEIVLDRSLRLLRTEFWWW